MLRRHLIVLLAFFVLTVVLMSGLTMIINRTELGRAQRAAAADPLMAALCGIDVDRTISITFVIGASLAWLFFNGHSVSTLGGAFAQVVFQLTVTRALIITGIVWACVIGLLGGFFPALRAARLPVAEALRAA